MCPSLDSIDRVKFMVFVCRDDFEPEIDSESGDLLGAKSTISDSFNYQKPCQLKRSSRKSNHKLCNTTNTKQGLVLVSERIGGIK